MSKRKIIEKIPPKKNPISVAVKADQGLFLKLQKPFIKAIGKSMDQGVYSEAFLLSWGFVEQILLPSLIRSVAHRLNLKQLPKIDENIHFSQLINYYYFLTHDLDLYRKLVMANKMRKEIVHRLDEENLHNLNGKTKKAARHTLKLSLSILNRISGETAVPVLELYTKGWNDYRVKMLENLERLKRKYS